MFNLTTVDALNAEPKSIPITCPDDVSIRKLNKSLNDILIYIKHTSIDVDHQYQEYNDLYTRRHNL